MAEYVIHVALSDKYYLRTYEGGGWSSWGPAKEAKRYATREEADAAAEMLRKTGSERWFHEPLVIVEI